MRGGEAAKGLGSGPLSPVYEVGLGIASSRRLLSFLEVICGQGIGRIHWTERDGYEGFVGFGDSKVLAHLFGEEAPHLVDCDTEAPRLQRHLRDGLPQVVLGMLVGASVEYKIGANHAKHENRSFVRPFLVARHQRIHGSGEGIGVFPRSHNETPGLIVEA